jgi:hypothetical protein
MIEYSIEELKYYYNNPDKEDIDIDSRDSIEYLEDTLTDLIDNDYTGNNIYHIFPIFVCAVATSFFASAYIAFG